MNKHAQNKQADRAPLQESELFAIQREDAQIENALRSFRQSIHQWSEQELARARSVPSIAQRSRFRSIGAEFWSMLANPVLASSLAAALIVTSAGVPLGIHHQRALEAQRQAVLAAQQKYHAEMAQKAAQAEAAKVADDEYFLDHLDNDIAQATPEAMQPLASLMSETKTR